jgi:hypothetical protein
MQKRKEDVIVSREVTLSSWKIISTEIIIQKPINLSWYSKTKTLLFYVSVQYEFLQRNCGGYFLPELSSLLDLLTLFLWRSFPICGSLQDDLSWSRRNCRKWTCLETYAEKKDDVLVEDFHLTDERIGHNEFTSESHLDMGDNSLEHEVLLRLYIYRVSTIYGVNVL